MSAGGKTALNMFTLFKGVEERRGGGAVEPLEPVKTVDPVGCYPLMILIDSLVEVDKYNVTENCSYQI